MSLLNFTVVDSAGSHPLPLDIVRCYNLGFTMRDAEKMQRHLEECYALGVKELICDRPPLVMPISPWAVLTDTKVAVQRPKTSGEVEIVTVADADATVYVGVGSDHTDRPLENLDIPWAKQVAPNIVAPTLWRWDEVRDHWDQVRMSCTVVDKGETVEYQDASVAEFWTPAEMLRGVRDSVVPVPGAIILFSGTVVTLEEKLRFAESWTLRMTDPVLGREITHTYEVEVLATEVLNDGSASGDVAKGEKVMN
jgi:Protein of unknown function (DUF2848)